MATRTGYQATLGRADAAERPSYSLRRRTGPWKDALRRRMLAAADLGAVAAALAAAHLVQSDGPTSTLWVLALVPVWIFSAKLRGLYDRDHVRVRHDTLDEFASLGLWAALAVAVTSLASTVLPGDPLSAPAALVMWGVGFSSALILRALARAGWRRLVPPERGLVLGSGQLADALARKLALESGHHLVLAARIELNGDRSSHGVRSRRLDELMEVVRAERIERVMVALHDLDEETLSEIVSTCRSLGIKLSVAPPLRAMLGTAVELNHLAELPLIEFRTWDPSRSTMLFKRTLDVVGSAVLLTVLSPVLMVVALVIRLDSPGPALLRQPRAGRDGRPFRMLKFRTMVVDASERLDEVIDLELLDKPAFKLRGDPRVTRVGRYLRRTSIDELPQLVNVLRGEMSLVGPRPEEAWLVERYEEAERFRLEMRPGMTGAMQVHGRGELSFQERVAVEREYVENYSLRKDLKILLRTISAVARGRGAF